jgi:hypothetical protein
MHKSLKTATIWNLEKVLRTSQGQFLPKRAAKYRVKRPQHYCMPLLQGPRDRQALLSVVASGCSRFFLGSDSAPHAGYNTRSEMTLPIYSASFGTAAPFKLLVGHARVKNSIARPRRSINSTTSSLLRYNAAMIENAVNAEMPVPVK